LSGAWVVSAGACAKHKPPIETTRRNALAERSCGVYFLSTDLEAPALVEDAFIIV